MNKKLAKIRPYYKYEMAELYKISKQLLSEWLEEIRFLLEEVGYRKAQQLFSLKHTEIIFAFLGHPKVLSDTDIQKGERVVVVAYSKSQLANMYGISTRTLMSQIDSIPNRKAKRKILTGDENYTGKIKKDKKIFRNYEVQLIFMFLGHPFTNENSQ